MICKNEDKVLIGYTLNPNSAYSVVNGENVDNKKALVNTIKRVECTVPAKRRCYLCVIRDNEYYNNELVKVKQRLKVVEFNNRHTLANNDEILNYLMHKREILPRNFGAKRTVFEVIKVIPMKYDKERVYDIVKDNLYSVPRVKNRVKYDAKAIRKLLNKMMNLKCYDNDYVESAFILKRSIEEHIIEELHLVKGTYIFDILVEVPCNNSKCTIPRYFIVSETFTVKEFAKIVNMNTCLESIFTFTDGMKPLRIIKSVKM